MTSRREADPSLRSAFRLAALAYLTYGLVYFVHAVLALTPERRAETPGGVPWWVFYVAGGLLVVCLPVLLWRGFRWLAAVLWLGPLAKAVVLTRRALASGGSARDVAFICTALVAAALIGRAAFLAFTGPPVEPGPVDAERPS